MVGGGEEIDVVGCGAAGGFRFGLDNIPEQRHHESKGGRSGWVVVAFA